MKQSNDLTFCTQQELDSFSSFFTQRISSYRRNTYFTQDLPMAVSLKYDTGKKKRKKQTELKHCEIFFRKYFLQVINVGADIIRYFLVALHELIH